MLAVGESCIRSPSRHWFIWSVRYERGRERKRERWCRGGESCLTWFLNLTLSPSPSYSLSLAPLALSLALSLTLLYPVMTLPVIHIDLFHILYICETEMLFLISPVDTKARVSRLISGTAFRIRDSPIANTRYLASLPSYIGPKRAISHHKSND